VKRERGVALIIALIVVALATILAARLGSQAALDQRRAGNLILQEQALQLALGAEAWAEEVLRQQAESGVPRDSLDQLWATPLPPLPIEGGTIQGAIEDMQGRFNLNNIVNVDGTRNDFYYGQFQRLLAILQLEPKWAPLLLDWIDRDNMATLPDGAEDGEYLAQVPPYLPANQPITSTSELLALPGFGRERYQRLAPFVAALPVGTQLNTCTASGVVLMSLAANMSYDFAGNADSLTANRQKGCFPMASDLQNDIPGPAYAMINANNVLSQRTSWFRVTVLVSIGTSEFTLYSLLERNGPIPRPILRTFGTE
jgi:general secretion pathway protein K